MGLSFSDWRMGSFPDRCLKENIPQLLANVSPVVSGYCYDWPKRQKKDVQIQMDIQNKYKKTILYCQIDYLLLSIVFRRGT